MRFDDVFKRCFVVVVCFMLGAAAYFQASAMMRLTGAALELDPKSVREALAAARAKIAPRGAALSADYGHATSAEVILERNPFDSATGSLLDKGPGLGPERERPSLPVFGADPYADPPCDAARVLLISESEDPSWSFAAVAGEGQKPTLRRLGDEVSGRVILAMSRDRIWLASNQSRCQAILGAQLTSGSGRREPPLRGDGAGPSGPEKANRGALPPDIEGRIRKLGEREIEIERSVVSDIMERQGELLGRVRVVPEKDGDRALGLKLLGIKPGSLLGVLGMENGDRLTKINGKEIDPSSAMELYARLSSTTHLVVSVERRGKPMNIDISIK